VRVRESTSATTRRLAADVARLLGTPCTVSHVLSERRLPSAGTVLVVALETASGTTVVARRGPPLLVSAGAVSQAAAATAAAAREGDRVLHVPRVLAAAPGLAISERAPGEPLDGFLERGDLGAVRLAGRALAELACLPVEGPPRRLADHVAELLTPEPTALASTGLRASLALTTELTTRAVLAAEVAGPVGFVHRDVRPRRLLVDGPRVWLLDWDLAGCGDPALDLATLLHHSRSGRPGPVADRVAEAVLEGYAPTQGLLDRLPALEAFVAVRLACEAARLRGAAAESDVSELLRRARLALAVVAQRG
jgi:hypothetical protein